MLHHCGYLSRNCPGPCKRVPFAARPSPLGRSIGHYYIRKSDCTALYGAPPAGPTYRQVHHLLAFRNVFPFRRSKPNLCLNWVYGRSKSRLRWDASGVWRTCPASINDPSAAKPARSARITHEGISNKHLHLHQDIRPAGPIKGHSPFTMVPG